MKEYNEDELILDNLEDNNNFLNEGDEVEDEIFSKYSASIPETASDKIFNSIVRIEFNNSIGTGFLIQIKTKLKIINFLLTCNHVIEEEDVDSKKTIKIFYGKKSYENENKILLDKELRFIKCFKKPIDITIIQILNSDRIPCDKYLIPDYNYKKGYDIYLNGKFYLAGYPIFKSNYKGERHICSGKIVSIANKFEFKHTLDTFSGSSGSPLCLIDNQTVIGIHKQGNKKTGFNYGTFIGIILDYLSKEEILEDEVENDFSVPKFFNELVNYGKNYIDGQTSMIRKSCPTKLFNLFTLEEYNNNIINFHNNISEHYKNQNEENFDANMGKLINFINKENIIIHCDNTDLDFNNDLFITQLMELKNNKKIIDDDLLENINNLLNTENKQILGKISYFVAKLMMELNAYPFLDEKKCVFEFEEFMNISDLKKIKRSTNQIIFIKNFIKVEKKVDSFFASLFDGIDSFKKIIRKIFDFQYKVKILINYNQRENNIPTCFKNSEDEKYMFPPFSFFKVMNVEIKNSNNSGTISLNNVGRKEILENKDNLRNGLIYNINENIIEIKNN
jgi:V8-like Glu-specific endopeptidase